MRLPAILAVAWLVAGPALAVLPQERLADPALEARARELSIQLRCQVCQNQSIDDSNAMLAQDLRKLVRERLVAGDSDAAVLAFMVRRYGDYVLLDPPVQRNTWVLWFGPLALVAAAAIGLGIFYRRRRSALAAVPARLAPEEEAQLARHPGRRAPDAMMTWIVLAAMTAAVAAILALPLTRRGRAVAPSAAHDLEVYRDQLAEIERDRARGTLNDSEAEAARAEIARRVLAAAGKLTGQTKDAPAPTASARLLPIAAALAAPLAALIVYVTFSGSPGLPGQPFAARQDSPDDTARRIIRMVEGLAERLKTNPDDLEGWTRLARSYVTLDRPEAAVAAWRKVMALSNDSPAYAASLGESLVREANGMVTPEARQVFERALAADPREARASFYLGLAFAQEGDARQALQTWTDMVARGPADAPWIGGMRERINRTAAEARIDPASIKPSPEALAAAPEQKGPSAADVEAIQRMSPEQRSALVRGMVDQLAARLKDEPGDLEGWRRLARASQVLGETQRAKEAYEKAVALAPDRPEVLVEYAGTLLGDRGPGQKLPAEFVALMRRVLDLDGENGDALWFVGLAELELGHKDAAIALWEKLIGRLPPNSPAYAEVKSQLDRLRAPN